MIELLAEASSGFDWSNVIELGPAFAVMALFIGYLMKDNTNKDTEIGQLNIKIEGLLASKEVLLRETITILNKSSFVLENAPSTMRQHVREAIKEEMKELKISER